MKHIDARPRQPLRDHWMSPCAVGVARLYDHWPGKCYHGPGDCYGETLLEVLASDDGEAMRYMLAELDPFQIDRGRTGDHDVEDCPSYPHPCGLGGGGR